MDFELDEEQLHLQEVARDFVEAECPASVPRAVVEGTGGWEDLWKTISSLEWPGLTVPAEYGGSDASAVELAIILEELGRGADPTPFLATTSQYVPVVRESFGDRAGALLAAVCTGGTGAVAFAADHVRAASGADGWTLTGTAPTVIDGDRAEEIAVVATTADHEPGVFVVPANAVTATRTPAFDGTLHVADVTFDDVTVAAERSAVGADVAHAVERARHEALTGLAASAVGACQRILDLALDHIRSRQQFGVPIGSFQAVKHMAVDVFVAIERARALYQFAALTIVEDDGRRAVAASMAKAAAGDAQRIAVRHGIQLFGGLGYTWENDLQIFVRRAKAGALLLGTSAEHRAEVARMTLTSRSAEEAVA